MGENSKIEWTDHTFNPWIGCQKVSPGCQHCYAEQLMDKRYGRVQWGPTGTRVRTSDANWRKPAQWDRQAAADGVRRKVFCASLADVFEDRSELIEWRAELFAIIERTPNLDWLLLTKRPENVMEMLPTKWRNQIPDNIWLGTSVENQEQADKRIPHLLKVPARIRFLSMEPLLGPVDLCLVEDVDGFEQAYDVLRGVVSLNGQAHSPISSIRWVIVGGESGPHARPMHPDWVRSIVGQCQSADVPFFFKQWGEWYPDRRGIYAGARSAIFGDTVAHRVGKRAAGRLLDGREWNEFPQGEELSE